MTGATSVYDLETFQGFQYASFQIAALARGHLQNDYYLEDTIEEENFQMTPNYLRKMFGILLATCQPIEPLCSWNFSYNWMTEDWIHQSCENEA